MIHYTNNHKSWFKHFKKNTNIDEHTWQFLLFLYLMDLGGTKYDINNYDDEFTIHFYDN